MLKTYLLSCVAYLCFVLSLAYYSGKHYQKVSAETLLEWVVFTPIWPVIIVAMIFSFEEE